MMKPLRKIIPITAVLMAVIGAGYGLDQHAPRAEEMPVAEKANAGLPEDKGKILYYRNPMGLPDTSPGPKKDTMGMDYVAVYEHETQDDTGMVRISPERIQKLGVRTETAERRALARTVHAVGTIQIDETRQTIIAPRFEGWIEKLYVGATGIQVKKGDPLFVFYSPDLVHIEAEYPFSHRQNMTGDMGDKMAPAPGHPMNGTIERLRSLALPQDEIDRLQREETANYHMTLRAPADGAIMEKHAIEGMKFSSGDMLFRLVDLSNVWVMVDIYERDWARVASGQTATITINAFPGKTFAGKVSFIYPDINRSTRTAKIRIDLPNPTGALRTEMYADVAIESPLGSDVLTVPAAAVLNSGERQIVLVDLGRGRFQPRPVKVGASGDGHVEILDGLNEGDRVVTSANFLIDAESNMRAALQGFTAPEAKP
jgi:Cu(I)/Ag(I) efflux system membrane fusion protein